MSFRIVIDPTTFRLSSLGPSTGELWVSVGDYAFPAERWNDFVVVILEAWASASLRLAKGSTAVERVHFMDGPYELEMTPRAHDASVRLRAIERRRIERACTTIDRSKLLSE